MAVREFGCRDRGLEGDVDGTRRDADRPRATAARGRTRSGAVPRAILVLAACASLAVILGGAPAAGSPAAWADEAEAEKPKKSVDADAVYVGDSREWSKPAEVDADAVFAKIDEYKEIVDGKLEPTDPKYGVLMCKVRKKFLAAVRAAAKDGGYDLVARVGSVKGVENVPVITQDAIAKL